LSARSKASTAFCGARFTMTSEPITSARLAGGTKEVIGVVDQLVKLAREERARQSH